MDTDWIIVKNFKHSKGAHCESTPLRDIANFLGYSYDEPMAFGLDGTLGFVFWDLEKWDFNRNNQGPMFLIGGKQGWFNEKSLLCRVSGIINEYKSFKSSKEAWNDVIESINNQNPLMIQVDMAFLPYFNYPDMHFGGHFISIIGYNLNKEMALVCDNEFEEPIEVKIEDLIKARSSTEGPEIMRPHNNRYVLKKRTDGKKPPLPAALKLAVQEVASHMVSPSMNHVGLPGLEKFLEYVSNWEKTFPNEKKKAKSMLMGLHGYIEEYGTGGALFRNLYADFLTQIINNSEVVSSVLSWKPQEVEKVKDSLPLIDQDRKKWSEFASLCKKALDSDNEDLKNEIDFNKVSKIIEDIFYFEKDIFTNLSKIKI